MNTLNSSSPGILMPCNRNDTNWNVGWATQPLLWQQPQLGPLSDDCSCKVSLVAASVTQQEASTHSSGAAKTTGGCHASDSHLRETRRARIARRRNPGSCINVHQLRRVLSLMAHVDTTSKLDYVDTKVFREAFMLPTVT